MATAHIYWRETEGVPGRSTMCYQPRIDIEVVCSAAESSLIFGGCATETESTLDSLFMFDAAS